MKVWLSRSRPGADRQAADLRAAGHDVVVAPVVDVERVGGKVPGGRFDVVIFLSEHAVRLGLPALLACGWFSRASVLAVGGRTARVLKADGVAAEAPEQTGSEALLAMPLLARPAGRRVLLVTGAGGRSLLATTLAERGAEVQRFECYRRAPVPGAPPAVLQCDAIIAASGEGLERVAALWLAAGGRNEVPVLVPSARVARLGVELGLSSLHDCGGADSAAWLRGLASLNPDAP